MNDTILKRTEGNLTYHVFREVDEDADLSYLEQDYTDCPKKERATYLAQDKARLAAYRRGEWYPVGVVCEISIHTKTNWAVDLVIARVSLWGIESDSDAAYFLEVAEDQIAEAKQDLKELKKALREHETTEK